MTCALPAVPVGTIRDRMYARASAARIPMSAAVEIIATCNFKCVHCYIAPCAERHDVMAVGQADIIFGKLARAGTLSLLLTGGEVFTHKQFREIYLSAKRHGLMPNINTNGYLIGPRWADFLAEYPPELVSISLYGLTSERYEQVTGIPNSFERVVRALDLLEQRGVPFELKCPAMTPTADEIPAMKAFAAARGVSFRYDTILSPQERGDAAPLQLQLAPKTVVDLDEQMNPGYDEFHRLLNRAQPRDRSKVYRCGGGRTALAVNVHGGVSTCVTSRQVVGNLLEEPFEEIWAALGNKVERRFPDGHPCATCRFRSMCVACPATVEQVTGAPEGYVQQYCKITHLRAQRMGIHATGIPRTVTEGIPAGVRTVSARAARALPVVL
ncbi:MAG: radical SAM/SPASM domain-containing protein [Gemmatimonadaceae bacterium]